MQEAYYKNNKVHYTTKGYEFIFKNEDQVYYKTLITRPSHLQIVRNDTKYSNSELLDKIIDKKIADYYMNQPKVQAEYDRWLRDSLL